MRRVFLGILLLLFFIPAPAETPAPPSAVRNPAAAAEAAKPILTLIAACPSFYSFEGVPSAALAEEVVASSPFFLEGIAPADVLPAVFACPPGEENAVPSAPSHLPTLLEIESAIDAGSGRVRVSVRAMQDFGFGLEFGFYADFTLVLSETAPYGALVESAFIPD